MVAEAFGTFMLTLGVLGTLAFALFNGYVSWLVVALVSGLLLAAAIAAFGRISGGHFNPAVTLGAALAGRLPWRDVLPYILAQILGAIAAAFVVWSVIPAGYPALAQVATRADLLATTASAFGERGPLHLMSQGIANFPTGVALLTEIIFSAIFVGVVLGLMRRHHRYNPAAPLMIGLTWAALYLISWPITSGGLNPARSLASAVFAGQRAIWQQLWLFALAPLIGAALAALFYRAFQPLAHHEPEEAEFHREPVGMAPTVIGDTGWVQDGPATVDVQEIGVAAQPVVAVAAEPATTVVESVGTVSDGYAGGVIEDRQI